MSFRHVVAIRFMTQPSNVGGISDREAGEFYADLFGRYTLKSLLNMENRSFETVFLVRDSGGLSYLGPLMEHAVGLDASFVRYSEFPSFVERLRGDGNLIVSRCDADDLYASWVIDDVQKTALMREMPFVFGYQRSLMYRIGDGRLRVHEKNYGKGHWSSFQSLVYGRDERLRGVTTYSWNHTDFFSELSKRGFTLNELRRMKADSSHEGYPYVWMRNGRNISRDDADDDARYPETNIVPKEYVLRNFGVELPLK